MKTDLSLATQVHSYRRADNPEKLVEAVKNVFAEVGSGSDAAQAAPRTLPSSRRSRTRWRRPWSRRWRNVADHPIGEQPPPVDARAGGRQPSPEQYDPFQPGLPPPPPSRRGELDRQLLLLPGQSLLLRVHLSGDRCRSS